MVPVLLARFLVSEGGAHEQLSREHKFMLMLQEWQGGFNGDGTLGAKSRKSLAQISVPSL